MLPDSIVAGFSAFLLIVFMMVNVYNFASKRRIPRRRVQRSSIRASESSYADLAGLGTLIFWVDSLLFPSVIYTGFLPFLNAFPLRIVFPFDSIAQAIGLTILAAGYVLFEWSIIARGRYAISWNMPEDHKLITSGPYRYVRHPSYLAYFLMFLGLALTWLNLLTIPSLIAVPGYYYGIDDEEKILIERFGDEYREYQEKTGRFFPRFGKTRQQ